MSRATVIILLAFLPGCRCTFAPGVVLVEIGDPTFTKLEARDGAVVMTGEGMSLNQRQALVGVVEGAVRGFVKP